MHQNDTWHRKKIVDENMMATRSHKKAWKVNTQRYIYESLKTILKELNIVEKIVD